MIDIVFHHWRYEFTEKQLARYGSPHFDKQSLKHQLLPVVNADARQIDRHKLNFQRSQLICANEAFPEAALSDPLADLEVWEEWRTGVRAFPYPGKYGRLGIRYQDAKVQSPSSVGVIGEILAGLFAQAGISPFFVVRVVRRWPDFILFDRKNDEYPFVEAKAFTAKEDIEKEPRDIKGLVPDNLLTELLSGAVQQLNADPYTSVWGAFTQIAEVVPFRFRTTFLELRVPNGLRESRHRPGLPGAARETLIERTVQQAIASMEETEDPILSKVRTWSKVIRTYESQSLPKRLEEELTETLSSVAQNALDETLVDAVSPDNVFVSRRDLEDEIAIHVSKKIDAICKHMITTESKEGRRLYEATRPREETNMLRIRSVADSDIVLRSLTSKEIADIRFNWKRDWKEACTPYQMIESNPGWRCGGVIIALDRR